MRLRLTGTRLECERLTALMTTAMASGAPGALELLEVSDFYPNRGATVLGRVYVEVRFTAPAFTALAPTLTGARSEQQVLS